MEADGRGAPGEAGGAYGLRLEGLRGAALVRPVPRSWLRVEVARRPPAELPAGPEGAAAALALTYPNGWSLHVGHEPPSLTFFVPPEVTDDELVHPFLSPAAIELACALGHAVFHAGAFVAGGRAWALLGEREGGKSTTLAMLARAGAPVVCDDVLVLEGAEALAGPRCIDLRPRAAARFFGDAATARGGLRRRVELPPIAPATPLGGFFFLGWGDHVAARPLGAPERLAELSRYCRPEVRRIASLLDLAALPGWRLERPRRLEVLDDVCRQLLETAAG
jgi:hypothetical protein